MNLKSIIEDMEMKDTVEEMINEACTQGLMIQTGFRDGEATYALTSTGRKLIETCDLYLHCEAYRETEQD